MPEALAQDADNEYAIESTPPLGGSTNTALMKKSGPRQARPWWLPSGTKSRQSCEYDRPLYKARHLIENYFARLKQYQATATRYDKNARNSLEGIAHPRKRAGAPESVVQHVSRIHL